MIRNNFNVCSFNLFFSNHFAQCSVLIILVFSFVFSYFISAFSGVLLALAFFSGVFVFNVLWINKYVDLQSFIEFSNQPGYHVVHQSTGCSVCGNSSCKRQKNSKENQPWLGLNIPTEVDQAIQDLFNKILNEFVTTWHGNFTKDESFINELRRGLRYASSIVLRRILQVDVGEVITDQLVTTGLRHLNDYSFISKISIEENIPIEAAAVKYLNKKLHPAVCSRNTEMQYLRCLSDLLLDYLAQPSQLKCLTNILSLKSFNYKILWKNQYGVDFTPPWPLHNHFKFYDITGYQFLLCFMHNSEAASHEDENQLQYSMPLLYSFNLRLILPVLLVAVNLYLVKFVPSSKVKMSFRVLIRELLTGWVLLPLTDTLSDPYIINSLILLALSSEPLTAYPNHSAGSVQFLHRFVIPNKDSFSKKSVLQSTLSEILKDQNLLYTFMQFLKKEGAVHILQFCLDVEEFSRKILNPELSQVEMENLHKEAWDLYSLYFKPDSPESIHFPKHIIQQMENVLGSEPSNVIKLRTNPALFKAYEVSYSVLEETYCPLFYLSDDFFPLLCGERHVAKHSKTISPLLQPGSPGAGRGGKRPMETSTVGKLSSKFHKLLQFQVVEGRAYFDEAALDLTETECAENFQVDISPESIVRDMSTWHVTLPSVTTQQDSNSKPYPVFTISVVDVGSNDSGNLHSKTKWSVKRKYHDFYLLQAKLTEFHGEFEDGTQLPPKTGMFSPRGSEYLESRRQLFEEYLRKLLQKPNLRGSDLLYFFLHSPVEFSSCLSAQDGIGKIIRKSVEPIKLRKERGQHLENFLNLLLASTEGTKRSGKLEWQDMGITPKRKKRSHTSSIFNNNFQPYLDKMETSDNIQKSELNLIGPWDCILYLMSKFLGASPRTIQAVTTFRNLLGQSSDELFKTFIRRKLESVLVPARVSHLVRLLQDSIFGSNYHGRKQDAKSLRNKVSLEIERLTNSVVIQWFLPNATEGVEKVMDALQHPILNKHLCYCLLDEIVRVLFPEMTTTN